MALIATTGGPDARQDSMELAMVEGGDKWWRCWQAGERARLDSVQERFDEWQRREAVIAYLGAGAFTTGLLVLGWLLMGW